MIKIFKDVDSLAVFGENHDLTRFLGILPDKKLYRNFLAYILTVRGIPIIYYGSEQSMFGLF